MPKVLMLSMPVLVARGAFDARLLHDGQCPKQGWLGQERTRVKPTLDACTEYCRSIQACGYVSYNALTRVCATYAPMARCPEQMRKFLDFKSYEVRTLPTVDIDAARICLFHEGTCGDGLIEGQTTFVSDTAACATWCGNYEICRHFVYDDETRMCTLYNGFEGCPEERISGKSKSYILLGEGEACEPKTVTTPYHKIHDGKCSLALIGTAQMMEECVVKCHELKNSGCSHFSYNKRRRQCELYSLGSCVKLEAKGFVTYTLGVL